MPHLTSIRFQNLRGLTDLTLGNLRRFNLIVGPSEIGKTTILEGIYAGTTLYLPGLGHLGNLRGANMEGYDNISAMMNALFRNGTEERIVIDASINKSDEQLAYHFQTQFSQIARVQKGDLSAANNGAAALGRGKLDKICAEIKVSGDLTGTMSGELLIRQSIDPINHKTTLTRISDKTDVSKQLSGYVVASNFVTSSAALPSSLYQTILHKQKGELLALLQKINPAICGIENGSAEGALIDIGLPKMMPIDIEGSGVKRIITSLGAFHDSGIHVVLDDEIGDGVHYVALYHYLRALLHAARAQNKQVFATTHRKDVLEALLEIAEEEPDLRDDIMCHSLARPDDVNTRVYDYDYDNIKYALETNAEIR